MDTDDVPSSEQSDVVSIISEIATDTDVTSSEDDSDHDSSSTDYSLLMDDAPHSMSLSSNCSDSSNSLNSPEDSHEEMQPRNADQRNSQDHGHFWWDSLEHGQREPLCIECKLNRFLKVQTKVKRLCQLRRSTSEIIKNNAINCTLVPDSWYLCTFVRCRIWTKKTCNCNSFSLDREIH